MKQCYTIAKLSLLFSTVILTSNNVSAEVPQYFKDLQAEQVKSDDSIFWTQMGPGMSGNNLLVHWHNTDPKVLFLGPNMDNAYRSTDKGHTYHTILDADGNGSKLKDRGPYNIQSPEFSYQEPNVGFATHDDRATLWKTTNKGKTWKEQTGLIDTWEGYRLSDITVDPTNDNVWFAGTGLIYNVNEFGFSHEQPRGFTKASNRPHKARIWKSTDKGVNWDVVTPAGINSNAQITKIIVNPENSNHVYAATTYGFYKSKNGGASWTLKGDSDFDHNIIRAMTMHHNKSSGKITLYAIDLVKWKAVDGVVKNNGGGVFKSTDGGENWTKHNGNLNLNIKPLMTDYSFKKGYYQAVGQWFGISESQAKEDFPESKITDENVLMHRLANIIVDPNNANRIFVFNDYKGKVEYTFKGGIVWKSENGGNKWKVTLRNGKAWEGVHKDFWEARGNPTSYNLTLAGQRKWKQEDSYWRKAGSAFAYNADGSVLMGQIAKVLLASYDHGETWEEIDEVELSEGSEVWVAAGNSNMPGHGLIQDKRLPDRTFFATGENDYWVTRPGGEAVRENAQAAERINMDEHGEFSVSSIAFHPNDVDTIYSLQFRQTKRGHLLKSTDGGQTFVSQGIPLPEPWPESSLEGLHQLNLTIDPVKPKFMYFNVPKSANDLGYVGNSMGLYGVYRSSNNGVDWEPIHAGLPETNKDEDNNGENDVDVAVIRLDPNTSSTIYAGVYSKTGDGGLFKSTNRGDTWTKMPLPAGIGSVNDIHFDKNGKFYISTGSTGAELTEGGLFSTTAANPSASNWTKLFHMPFTGAVTTAEYDKNIILLAVLPANINGLKNAGSYLSKDGGATWIKINTGNGQSDRINDVAIHLTEPDVYFVSTRGAGVFRSFMTETTPPTGTEKITLAARQDVDVKMSHPDINFNNTQLKMIPSKRHAYVEFKTEGLTYPIQSAKLFIYNAEGNPVDGTITAHKATNGWDEATATYNTKSDLGAAIKSIDTSAPGWYSINVTSYINDNKKYTIGLSATEQGQVFSSEHSEHKPYLKIVK